MPERPTSSTADTVQVSPLHPDGIAPPTHLTPPSEGRPWGRLTDGEARATLLRPPSGGQMQAGFGHRRASHGVHLRICERDIEPRPGREALLSKDQLHLCW